jgi:hypothetical protein
MRRREVATIFVDKGRSNSKKFAFTNLFEYENHNGLRRSMAIKKEPKTKKKFNYTNLFKYKDRNSAKNDQSDLVKGAENLVYHIMQAQQSYDEIAILQFLQK